MKSPTILLCLLLIFVPTAKAGQSVHPVKVEFGLTTVGLQGNETKALFRKSLSELNIKWLRVVRLDWEKFEPAPPIKGIPRYKWQGLDGIIRSLQEITKDDIKVVLLIHPTSSWAADPRRYKKARSGRKVTNTPPRPANIKHWQRALEDLFDRYNHDGRNDMPGLQRPFKHWQIGNEYMNPSYWDGTAEEYIEVLRTAYEAKKKVDPSIEIILSGIAELPSIARYDTGNYNDLGFSIKGKMKFLGHLTRFTKEILRYPQYFDFIDVHIFNHFKLNPNAIPDAMDWLKRQISSNGYSKPYGALEWTALMTFMDARDKGTRKSFKQNMRVLISEPFHRDYDRVNRAFEIEQAQDFAKVFVTMIGHGLVRNIYVQFRDLPRAWKNPMWDKQGLMRARKRGEKIEGPKPVYFVYKNLLKKLSGNFDKVERVPARTGIYVWKFVRGSDEMIVIWSEKGDQKVDLKEIAVAQPGQLRTFDLISGEKKLLTDKMIRITSSPVMVLK